MNEISVRDIDVNGVTLRVHEAGDPANPSVVLSHGFPELAHSWRNQLPTLAAAGYHVVAPNQRGYGHSSAPTTVDAYGVRHLTGDLVALLDHYGKDDAVFVGHDWGAMIVWETARLHPQRVRAAVGVSVPFVQWPAPPTRLLSMVYGDRFFYILYFQQVGPADAELGSDPRRTMGGILYGASAAGIRGREAPAELPPMDGTGFLTMLPEAPKLPLTGPEGPWLTEAELQVYVEEFTHSGFFGPLSYYRNLDANFEVVKDLAPDTLTMPTYFIAGALDPVLTMDPTGVERMHNLLPDFRGHTMIADAGHWVQQEAPNAFNDALLGFLATLSAG